MRGTAFAASFIFLAAGASAAPLFLDAKALRAEVAVRRGVYGQAPEGAWATQARVLDRVLRSLDTSSRSLGQDLGTVAESARLLERSFGGDELLSNRLGAILDEGDALVEGTLDHDAAVLEAAPPGMPARRVLAALDSARRLLERSRGAASAGARGRLLERAFARIESARASMGTGPGSAEASATVAIGSVFGGGPNPTEFIATGGGALVTLDGNGNPSALLLRFRRAAPGGPASASLEIRLDAGFTGTGTWPMPMVAYDHDGLGTQYLWSLGNLAGFLATDSLSITGYDPAEGRISGTFLLGASTNIYRQSFAMTGGTFEVSGILFRGP